MDEVTVLLLDALVLFCVGVSGELTVDSAGALAKRWWKLVEKENQVSHSDPAGGIIVVVLPVVDKKFDLVTLNNSHILFFSGIESFNDCGY